MKSSNSPLTCLGVVNLAVVISQRVIRHFSTSVDSPIDPSRLHALWRASDRLQIYLRHANPYSTAVIPQRTAKLSASFLPVLEKYLFFPITRSQLRLLPLSLFGYRRVPILNGGRSKVLPYIPLADNLKFTKYLFF